MEEGNGARTELKTLNKAFENDCHKGREEQEKNARRQGREEGSKKYVLCIYYMYVCTQ